MKKIYTLVFAAIMALGACIAANAAETSSPADAAWTAIYAPIDGLNSDTMHDKFKHLSPEWWNWQNRWRKQVTLRGMAFWDAYPQDARRWEWLNKSVFQNGMDRFSPPAGFASAESREADAAWDKRRMEFRAAMMARSLTSPDDRTWQSARWYRLYDEFEKKIDDVYARRMSGEPVNPDPLLNDLIDYCIEMHLADAERGLPMGHLVTRAIDLALQGDVNKQAQFIDALTAAMQDLPEREDISRPRLKEYISGTLRPLHDIRVKPLELRMTSMDGKAIDLRQLRGKVVLVDFWNNGCSSCVEAMPHIQAIYDRYRERGFEVVGVVFNTEEERALAQKLFTKAGAKWPQSLQGKLIGENRSPLSQRFNFTGVPWTFLLDKDGKLVSTTTWGELLEPQVRKLLGMPAEEAPQVSSAH